MHYLKTEPQYFETIDGKPFEVSATTAGTGGRPVAVAEHIRETDTYTNEIDVLGSLHPGRQAVHNTAIRVGVEVLRHIPGRHR